MKVGRRKDCIGMGGGAEEERGMDMASGEEGKQLVRTAIALLSIPKLFAFGYFEIELQKYIH